MTDKCAAGPACFIDTDCKDDEKIEGIGSNETGCVSTEQYKHAFAKCFFSCVALAVVIFGLFMVLPGMETALVDEHYEPGANTTWFFESAVHIESGASEHQVDIHETDTIFGTPSAMLEGVADGVVRDESDTVEGGG